MPGNRSIHELLSDRHLAGLRTEYRVERVAWIGMGLVLVAAVLGGLGPGLLGQRRLVTPDGSLSVEYSAMERCARRSRLVIRVSPDVSSTRPVQLALSRPLVDRTELSQVTPPPDRIQTRPGNVVLIYDPAALSAGGPIIYRCEHEHYGPITFDVGLIEGQSVRIQQFVWP
jgi:hypothetical protein